MASNLILMRDSKSIKKTLRLDNGVFLVFAPRKLRFLCLEFNKYDTDLLTLQDNSQGYYCSEYK